MLKIKKVLSVYLVLCLSCGMLVTAQQDEMARDEMSVQAKAKFEEKKYTEALFFLNRLLEYYPRDPGYAYLAGVCYTELNGDLPKAIAYLQFAASEEAPENVYFYLGKAYFLSSDYVNALAHFRKYMKEGKKQELKDLLVESYIEMCETRIDPSAAAAGYVTPERKEAVIQPLAQPGKTAAESPATDYDNAVEEALRIQSEADSLRRLAEKKRAELASATDPQLRREGEAEINRLEQEERRTQQRANDAFTRAGEMEVPSHAASRSLGKEAGTGEMEPEAPPEPSADFNATFYRQKEFRKLFRMKDLQSLEEMDEVVKTADKLMTKSNSEETKLEKMVLQADAAKSPSEQKRLKGKIEKQKTTVFDLRLKAMDYYQLVNDDKYALFGKTLDASLNSRPASEVDGVQSYIRMAAERYDRAAVLRQQATGLAGAEKKYRKMAESHAYGLVALENQKRAFEVLAGLREPITLADAEIPYLQEIPVNRPAETTTITPVNRMAGVTGPQSVGEQRKESASQREEADADHTSPVTIQKPAGEDQTSVAEVSEVSLPTFPATEGLKPSGLSPLYYIQLIVLSRPPDENIFQSLGNVTSEFIPETKLTRYYKGEYPSFDAAQRALSDIRSKGFSQAFIVATYEGKKISVNRARVLEKGPETEVPAPRPSLKYSTAVKEGMPVYKVQVGAFRGDVPPVIIQKFVSAAPDAPLEKFLNSEGITVYTLGNFYTFEEAAGLRKHMLEKGISDAFVVAFHEGSRIPVEEARKISSGHSE